MAYITRIPWSPGLALEYLMRRKEKEGGEVNERRGERKEGTDAGESKDKRQS